MKFNAGKFEIEVWTSGAPIWCRLKYDGEESFHGVTHEELLDLQYIVGRAIAHAQEYEALLKR